MHKDYFTSGNGKERLETALHVIKRDLKTTLHLLRRCSLQPSLPQFFSRRVLLCFYHCLVSVLFIHVGPTCLRLILPEFFLPRYCFLRCLAAKSLRLVYQHVPISRSMVTLYINCNISVFVLIVSIVIGKTLQQVRTCHGLKQLVSNDLGLCLYKNTSLALKPSLDV